MKKALCLMLVALILLPALPAALAEAAQTAAPEADQAALPDEGVADAPQDAAADQTAQPDDGAQPDAAAPESAPQAGDRTVDIDGQFTFTCPGTLTPNDINQQDMDDGLLYSAFSDTMGVDIYKYPEQDGDTLDSIYQTYKTDDSMSEVTLASVNGVKVLVYRIDETGINATLMGDTGFMYDIMFTYQTPEEYQLLGKMIGSLKKAGA